MLFVLEFLMCVCICTSSPFKSSPVLASRLCKAAMLSRFNLVAKEAQREELHAAVTYREAKVLKMYFTCQVYS